MKAPQGSQAGRALRGAPRRALPLGVLFALGLHGSALGVAALAARGLWAPPPAPRTALTEPLHWLDAEPMALPEAPSAVQPPGAAAASSAVEPTAGAARGASPAAARARQPRLAALRRAASGAAPNPPSGAVSSGSDVAALPGGEGESEAEGAEQAGEARGPTLSLEQLGIGKNPFLTPPAAPTAAEVRAALGRRIDHVLREGLAKRDQELGLGPEGPAVAKVIELVMQSSTRPNTSALLSLRTDASGEVVHVELAEAGGDTRGWNAVAAELLRSLRGKKLRIPSGTGGVTLQLKVDSREQLPSGADPGLAIDLFGQELKAGQGDRSTRISLLTPKIVLETYQPTSDPRVKIPVVGLSLTIFSLAGDPTDIGAPARRVVHAHLVSMQTHPAD